MDEVSLSDGLIVPLPGLYIVLMICMQCRSLARSQHVGSIISTRRPMHGHAMMSSLMLPARHVYVHHLLMIYTDDDTVYISHTDVSFVLNIKYRRNPLYYVH